MVSYKDKRRMEGFVAGLVEANPSYEIKAQKDGALLVHNQSKNKGIYVVLHHHHRPLKDFRSGCLDANLKGVFVCNIFYKDGNQFHVRLAGRAQKKKDGSMKYIRKSVRDKMLSLRGLEKEVLDDQRFPLLVYYQPKTVQLEESLRGFYLREEEPCYDHLSEDDHSYGFVKDGPWRNWRSAHPVFSLSDDFMFRAFRNNNSAVIIPNGFDINSVFLKKFK